MLRHPGDARVTTARARRGRQARLRALDLGRRPRPDLRRRPPARHAAAGPQPPARPRRPGLPGHVARSTSRSPRCPWRRCPDTFVHPAGFCQNVLATGRCQIVRHRGRQRTRGDPPRVRPPADDGAARRPAGLPHRDRGRPRDRRHPAPGRIDRRRRSPATRTVIDSTPDAPSRRGVRLRLPYRDDDALLSRVTLPLPGHGVSHRPEPEPGRG